MYDSMYMYSTLSSLANKDQICALLHTNQKAIHVQFVDVDKQEILMIVVSMLLHMPCTSLCHGWE